MSKNLFVRILTISSIICLQTVSFAATTSNENTTSFELSCRSQAKDVAVKTYQSCVTENKQKKLNEIRKEYQTKLNDLKKYYDSELKKLSGNSGQKNQTQEVTKISNQSGVVRNLPAKNQQTQTQSVQTQSEGVPVVVQQKDSSESEESSISTESVDAGQE